jgi:hypothetical protein
VLALINTVGDNEAPSITCVEKFNGTSLDVATVVVGIGIVAVIVVGGGAGGAGGGIVICRRRR